MVVLGNGTVVERRLGNHEAGVELPPTVTVTSTTVVGGIRTVAMTRTLEGRHFSFDSRQNSLAFINAIGGSPDFGYHVNKSTSLMYFVEADAPTCICDVAADQGTLGGYVGSSVFISPLFMPWPYSLSSLRRRRAAVCETVAEDVPSSLQVCVGEPAMPAPAARADARRSRVAEHYGWDQPDLLAQILQGRSSVLQGQARSPSHTGVWGYFCRQCSHCSLHLTVNPPPVKL